MSPKKTNQKKKGGSTKKKSLLDRIDHQKLVRKRPFLRSKRPAKLSLGQKLVNWIVNSASYVRKKLTIFFHQKGKISFKNPQNRQKKWTRFFDPRWYLSIFLSWKFFWITFRIGTILFLCGLISLIGLYLHYREDLPPITYLDSCLGGETTKYYDRTGQTLLWASKSDIDCQIVGLDEISPYLIDAVLASEDQNFYNHAGFEPAAIARAAINNIRGRSIQGGSTITQQYIKNAVLKERQKNLSRKFRELVLAIEMDRVFSKDEILKAYLNTISFGSVYQGIEASSQGYFNKKASQLTLAEASLLAAAIPAPTTYWANPDIHKERQRQLLKLMLDNGSIDQSEYKEALKVDVLETVRTTKNQYEDIKAPHFILEVEKRLQKDFNNGQSVRLKGWKVITTIDIKAQELAEDAIATSMPEIDKRGFDNAAGVAIDVKTGKVIAHVGSRDFDYPKFGQTDTVTTKRSPGSAFKPFNYATLMTNSSRWGPGSTFYDYQTVFTDKGYEPQNFNDKYHGATTMRRALGISSNVIAIKAMYIAGIDDVHQLAKQAGLRSGIECGGNYCGLSSGIGGGAAVRLDELTNAYATFARNGVYQPLTYIDKIYDSKGNLIHNWRPSPERVIKPEVAWLINDMLSDRKARYTQRFNLKDAVGAIKTGTTDDWRNNHIFGYTKSVVFGTWMGHHDITVGHEKNPQTTVPKAILLKAFMDPYHQDLPNHTKNAWKKPSGIQEFYLDLKSGYQISESVRIEMESEDSTGLGSILKDVYPSWYRPVPRPDLSGKIEIDLISKKRATVCTPPLALRKVGVSPINSELPPNDEYYENWMLPIQDYLGEIIQGSGDIIYGQEDDVHKCNDRLPRIKISSPPVCNISCRIIAEVTPGSHPVNRVNFLVDNQILPNGTKTVSNSKTRISYLYEPATSQEFQTLTAEVIDQALYSSSSQISLETIAGDIDNNEVTLDELKINDSRDQIDLAWSRRRKDLIAQFEGVCSFIGSINLPTNETEHSIGVDQPLVDGICRVNIVNQDGLIITSNQFEIDGNDIIYPLSSD